MSAAITTSKTNTEGPTMAPMYLRDIEDDAATAEVEAVAEAEVEEAVELDRIS
jgi:hypothetical protein